MIVEILTLFDYAAFFLGSHFELSLGNFARKSNHFVISTYSSLAPNTEFHVIYAELIYSIIYSLITSK